jgi:hypothetical protein
MWRVAWRLAHVHKKDRRTLALFREWASGGQNWQRFMVLLAKCSPRVSRVSGKQSPVGVRWKSRVRFNHYPTILPSASSFFANHHFFSGQNAV